MSKNFQLDLEKKKLKLAIKRIFQAQVRNGSKSSQSSKTKPDPKIEPSWNGFESEQKLEMAENRDKA